MPARFVSNLTIAVLLGAAMGCSTSPSVIRGQNPAGIPAAAATPTAVHHHVYAESGVCPVCGNNHGAHSPYGNSGDSHRWEPRHRHTYAYIRPQDRMHGRDLVYPPANQPGGIVVYPYYTLRGPSDFFRQ